MRFAKRVKTYDPRKEGNIRRKSQNEVETERSAQSPFQKQHFGHSLKEVRKSRYKNFDQFFPGLHDTTFSWHESDICNFRVTGILVSNMLFFVKWKTNPLVFYLSYQNMTVISKMFLLQNSYKDYINISTSNRMVSSAINDQFDEW